MTSASENIDIFNSICNLTIILNLHLITLVLYIDIFLLQKSTIHVYCFDVKFSLTVKLRGHKQRTFNDHVYSFLSLAIKLNLMYIENGIMGHWFIIWALDR